MTPALNGATRIIAIVGDPIAQVKSPAGVTQALIDRGCNAVVVPMHVAPKSFNAFMLVCDVITEPEVTPLLAAARRLGCGTSTGVDMFRQVRELMVEFLRASGPLAPPGT